jgi:hypothetical protein
MLNQLVMFVLYCIIAGAVIGLLLYAVAISPIPEPFKGWLRFAVILVAIFVVIFLLLGLVGVGGSGVPRIHVGQATGLDPNGYGIHYAPESAQGGTP